MTLRSALLLASTVLVLAGCGGGKSGNAADPAETKRNGGRYDSVDVCGLATDEQLRAALGEAPGDKERRDSDSLKACAVDGASGNFYLFLTVARPAQGARQQVDYDRGAADGAKAIDDTTFSFANDGEAYVETSNGELVLRVSFVYYNGGGTITDAPAVVGRLHTLLDQLAKKF